MPKTFQRFNKRNNAYVKMREKKNGSVTIINVKERMPKKPFKGVPIKK
jgi:uncharacterized protein YxeA